MYGVVVRTYRPAGGAIYRDVYVTSVLTYYISHVALL
jgi:hypothetical protein